MADIEKSIVRWLHNRYRFNEETIRKITLEISRAYYRYFYNTEKPMAVVPLEKYLNALEFLAFSHA